MKCLSYDDLRSKGIPYSKMQLWRLVKGGKFPRPLKLTDAANSPNVWPECEIDKHMADRIAARDAERKSAPQAA